MSKKSSDVTSSNNSLDCRINFRISQKQKQKLNEKLSNLPFKSPSDYLRFLIETNCKCVEFNFEQQNKITVISDKSLKKLLVEFLHQGNNLNQIAKSLHQLENNNCLRSLDDVLNDIENLKSQNAKMQKKVFAQLNKLYKID